MARANESSLPKERSGLTEDVTPLSLNQGKLHRLRCKVKNLEPQGQKEGCLASERP